MKSEMRILRFHLVAGADVKTTTTTTKHLCTGLAIGTQVSNSVLVYAEARGRGARQPCYTFYCLPRSSCVSRDVPQGTTFEYHGEKKTCAMKRFVADHGLCYQIYNCVILDFVVT